MNEEQVKEPRASYEATTEKTIADTPVAQMTIRDLEELVRSAVKEALQEVPGDPDAGLELKPEFEERLRQAIDDVASGGRLLSVEELTNELEGTGGV